MRQRGQSIIELLIALALAALMAPALIAGFIASREGKVHVRQRTEGVGLVREAEEAVRSVREAGWSNVSLNGTYHPQVSGSTWTLASGAESLTGGFTRSITIADAFRDSSGTIVAVGGTRDPSTKLVTVSVSWGAFFPITISSTLYLTRHTGNAAKVETTKAQFDAGTKTNVITSQTGDGEVSLAAGGAADWCAPNLTIQAVDLPKNGVANGITAIEGRVFAGTGDNASGVSFAHVTLSNDNPPIATIAGEFSNYKTNGIFGENNYAYIATDTNASEIVILQLTSTPYSVVGSFDAPGPTDANAVYVVGSVGYMTAGSTLYTFDLSSKTGSRPQLGSIALAGTGRRIMVVGNYAYIAVDSTTRQMEIVDVSNPAALSVVGWATLPAQGGVDVFVNSLGTRAYVATAVSATQRELFIIDVSNKTGAHSALGSYESNGMDPRGIRVVPGNKAIFVGVGGEEYQAVNIAVETAPTRCGGLNIDTGVNGVSSVLEADGDAYSYIITGDASTELKIIEGGPGGRFAKTGTYESSAFDAGSDVVFNRFVPSVTIPANTSISYQFAAADAVSGSCAGASYTFVGPDGTSATNFSAASALPLSTAGGYRNPARCLKYRVSFSSDDPSYTPILSDMTINYTP